MSAHQPHAAHAADSRDPSHAGVGPASWEQTWALWAHVGALLATIPSGFLLQFLVPLIIWLSHRHSSPFIADHAREALNFHISLLIWAVIGVVLSPICVGVVILVAIPIVMIVSGILAAVAASQGRYFRYPVTFRFV